MSHVNKDKYDKKRENELTGMGYTVLRFYDDYILNNLEDCKIYLYDYVQNLSSPNPLQRGQVSFKHILIVGGTGMLVGAVNSLIEKNCKISITGRNKAKLDSFIKNNPESAQNINLINSDYTDTQNFLSAIQKSEDKFGIVDTAILWVHSDGTNTLIKLIEYLVSRNRNVVIYHIKGSASYKPDAIKIPGIENLKDEIDYREVYLGFMNENGNSRWLTDKEVSDGVIYAFENNLKNHTIGITEPWELHP